MIKKLLSFALCLIVLIGATMTTVSADTGPKPSVVVSFEGLEQRNCYVTLLSETPSTGPYSVYNGNPEYAPYDENDPGYDVWLKFVSYEDIDGFYFLDYFTRLDEDGVFRWTYFPPSPFKILVYFPDTDALVVSSEIYERYAFDSYLTVDASQLGPNPADGMTVNAVRSYDYRTETVSLLARIIITIGLELSIALLFGFRAKKQLLVIGAANVVTQTVLNILLNIINYNHGPMAFVLNYIWLELLVIGIEAVVYCSTLKKLTYGMETKKRHPVLYALSANAVSFSAGLLIANLLPRLF